MSSFKFFIEHEDVHARSGYISLERGIIRTPAFMPVGTTGTVKGMYLDQVREIGSDIILGNTYHLMLRPGPERVQKLGGLHQFINWSYPILTDSGGFQVMSLSNLRKISEKGVLFSSHIDGKKYELTPEKSIEIQLMLDSDIIMQLDECVKLPNSEKTIREAMFLSLRWAKRSLECFGDIKNKALFGIVQGGDISSLRQDSAGALAEMNFSGYAIGGLAVGEPQETMLAIIDIVKPILPKEKPRYLMGVGTPSDLLQAIYRGIDMFDCVMPTRAGRHGIAFNRYGKINIKNSKYKDDPTPIDENSQCPATRDYSKAYLHHLFKSKELLGMMILSWSNLAYYQDLMKNARMAIMEKRYDNFMNETLKYFIKK